MNKIEFTQEEKFRKDICEYCVYKKEGEAGEFWEEQIKLCMENIN
jgi:hypothetical protein